MMLCDVPTCSPWGKIDRCDDICPGVFDVMTPTHGGIMVRVEIADRVLSKEAQDCGFIEGSFICFEEDCDAPVAIRELLDKGLKKAPVDAHFKEGEYSAIIDKSLQRWHPEYWIYHESVKAAGTKKAREREDCI